MLEECKQGSPTSPKDSLCGDLVKDGQLGGSGHMLKEGLLQLGSRADQAAFIKLGDSMISTGSRRGYPAELEPWDTMLVS